MTFADYFFSASPESHGQTIAALGVVAVTVLWLVMRGVSKSRHSAGCGGGGCGAVSKDAKKLQAHLSARRRSARF